MINSPCWHNVSQSYSYETQLQSRPNTSVANVNSSSQDLGASSLLRQPASCMNSQLHHQEPTKPTRMLHHQTAPQHAIVRLASQLATHRSSCRLASQLTTHRSSTPNYRISIPKKTIQHCLRTTPPAGPCQQQLLTLSQEDGWRDR